MHPELWQILGSIKKGNFHGRRTWPWSYDYTLSGGVTRIIQMFIFGKLQSYTLKELSDVIFMYLKEDIEKIKNDFFDKEEIFEGLYDSSHRFGKYIRYEIPKNFEGLIYSDENIHRNTLSHDILDLNRTVDLDQDIGYDMMMAEEVVNIKSFLEEDIDNILLITEEGKHVCISKSDLNQMCSDKNNNWFYQCLTQRNL